MRHGTVRRERGTPPEFALLAACCRWPPAPSAVRHAAQPKIDWLRFAALVKRHRVRGLVARALAEAGIAVGPRFASDLSQAATREAIRALKLAGAAVRLDSAFSDAGIEDHLFLKGSSLAILAYGSLALKESCDVDVLVPPARLAEAFDALSALGYVAMVDNRVLDDRVELIARGRTFKDTLWYHEADDVTVELHSRLFSNPTVLAAIPSRDTVEVDLGLGKLRTLPLDFLAVYLAVHGSLHAWSRLKWLADYSALLQRLPGERIAGAIALSRSLGAERPMAAAMALSQQLLGAPLPDFGSRGRARFASVVLSRHAAALLRRADSRELDEQAFGTLGINLAHFLVARGLKHKLAEAGSKLRQVDAPGDAQARTWQRSLLALTAVPRWIVRRFRKSSASRR